MAIIGLLTFPIFKIRKVKRPMIAIFRELQSHGQSPRTMAMLKAEGKSKARDRAKFEAKSRLKTKAQAEFGSKSKTKSAPKVAKHGKLSNGNSWARDEIIRWILETRATNLAKRNRVKKVAKRKTAKRKRPALKRKQSARARS